MDFIKQLKGFKIKRMDKPISANAICLYIILFEYNNELCFKEWFTVANSTLQGLTGLNISTLQRARNELVQKDYIAYRKGTGNQAGSYKLLNLYMIFEQQTEQQLEQQAEQQTDSSVNTLNKLTKTKLTNRKENIKEKVKKHKHGKYFHVLLTDEEYNRYVQKYGEDKTKGIIQYLDDYIETSGKSYKNHNLVIQKWVIAGYEKEVKQGAGNQIFSGNSYKQNATGAAGRNEAEVTSLSGTKL